MITLFLGNLGAMELLIIFVILGGLIGLVLLAIYLGTRADKRK